jgi:hypothetical protein
MIASPASAATACTVGARFGPYTWAGFDASNAAGHDRLLAVAPPWGLYSQAYIWDNNNDPRQQWVLECRGFQQHDQLNHYRFHYAYNDDLCLTALNAVRGEVLTLQTCGAILVTQTFELSKQCCSWSLVNHAFINNYVFIYEAANLCFDVFNGNDANGTSVELWDCNNQTNQFWY